MKGEGERLEPDDAVEASLQEHLGRYRFAKGRVHGRVLDVACGTGYGTAMLGAIGVDNSHSALHYAALRYPGWYVAADAARLPFGRIFDTIVSFETIEHVPDAERFVAECARVLRPGGIFLVSTPNRELWSPRSPRPYQHHHVREFNRKEFVNVLRPFQVELWGQFLLDRAGAALFEGRELAKRLVRTLMPIRRFRKTSSRRLEEIVPDPRYAVRLCGSRTAVIFVASAILPP